MPSWFKGKGKKTSQGDPFNEVGYFSNGRTTTETYTGGIAPVIITTDESDLGAESPKRSWKNRKPIAMFQDEEVEVPKSKKKSKKVGSGDLVGSTSDLDFCCIQDGALDCCGANNKMVLCGEEQDENKKDESSQRTFRSFRSSRSKDEEDGNTEKIRSIWPFRKGKNTDDEKAEESPEKLRSRGPIRDGGIKSTLAYYYMALCGPKLSTEKEDNPSKKRFRIALLMVFVAVGALIVGIVAAALRRQKNNRNNVKDRQIIPIKNNNRAGEFKKVLTLSSASDLDTPGTPQYQALRWLADVDPLAPTMENEVEIQERFAAATLYYATDGPGRWKTSIGFLGDDSICGWNSVEDDSIGIFCEDGRVTEINIVSHNLTGTMPTELNYFSEIVVLNLFFNNLTGAIPDLSNLTKMEQLDLDDNQLSGKIPESIFNLPSLVNLFLLFNKGLTGTIPEIEDSSKLVAISLLRCSMSGTLPKSLGNLSSLRLLQLNYNKIDGTIPHQLLSLPKLETLGLTGNQLSGSLPPVVVTEYGTELTSLSVGSNNLDGPLPYGFEDLSKLQYFFADNNKLNGSIRNAIMGLQSLEQLWLHGNEMTGDISRFLFDSDVLKDLYLSDNKIEGDLHDFLSFAPASLERLDLSGNRGIDGYISGDIRKFDELKYFNVSSCSLWREIPTQIGKLSSLETLDLSNNKFQGTIPEEIADMDSLSRFDISGNRDLGGDLSSTVCGEMFDLVFSKADCAGSPRVECDCCTHCCDRSGACGPNDN